MILTITLNPTVDVDFIVNNLQPGGQYRTLPSRRSPGGSGINVSVTLRRLGISSIAMGFLAGFNGAYLLDELRREKISTHFVHTTGETRINVCIIDPDTTQNSITHLHERGTEIPEADKNTFLKNYERILKRIDKIFIGGSLPPGIDASIYPLLMRIAKENSIPVVLHPKGDNLDGVLEEVPNVVKLDYRLSPSCMDVLQDEIDTFMEKASELHRRGTEWVLMSFGKEKVAFSTEKGAWMAEGSAEEMVYLHASEDALLAGMLAAMEKKRASPEEIVRLAMACNWECALHPEKFPQDRACVDALTPRVLITKIE